MGGEMGKGKGKVSVWGLVGLLTILVHGHQVTAGLQMHAQLKEDELT